MKKKMKKLKNKSANKIYSGVFTALITPFRKSKVDEKSLKRLVRHQLERGVSGFVVNGTTAESPTLTAEEVKKIFSIVKKESDNTVPLILGTGTNSTAETIERTGWVKKWGADAALVVAPYYNKPPQRGMVQHFIEIAKKTKVPVILYNVPGRTVVSMSADSIHRLSEVKNIIGIKEASGKIELLLDIKKKIQRDDFLLSSGDDASCIEFILSGGHGVISVVSHVIPSELSRLCQRASANDTSTRDDYKKFISLNSAMSFESNPIPVKMALFLMGIIDSPELRLPLSTLTEEYKIQLQKTLHDCGVL